MPSADSFPKTGLGVMCELRCTFPRPAPRARDPDVATRATPATSAISADPTRDRLPGHPGVATRAAGGHRRPRRWTETRPCSEGPHTASPPSILSVGCTTNLPSCPWRSPACQRRDMREGRRCPTRSARVASVVTERCLDASAETSARTDPTVTKSGAGEHGMTARPNVSRRRDQAPSTDSAGCRRLPEGCRRRAAATAQ